MKKDQINILKDRGIISVLGNDSKEFLQNIITNDINIVNKDNKMIPFETMNLFYRDDKIKKLKSIQDSIIPESR